MKLLNKKTNQFKDNPKKSTLAKDGLRGRSVIQVFDNIYANNNIKRDVAISAAKNYKIDKGNYFLIGFSKVYELTKKELFDFKYK